MAEIILKNVPSKVTEEDKTSKPVDLKLITYRESGYNTYWAFKIVPFIEGQRWSDINATYACGVIVKFKVGNIHCSYTCDSDDPNTLCFKYEPAFSQEMVEPGEAYIIRRTHICKI